MFWECEQGSLFFHACADVCLLKIIMAHFLFRFLVKFSFLFFSLLQEKAQRRTPQMEACLHLSHFVSRQTKKACVGGYCFEERSYIDKKKCH